MKESEAIGERGEIILIEDGAGAHSHHHVQDYHKKMCIKEIDWPASSPDFNPIEIVWNMIRKKISDRRLFPSTKQAAKRAWIEEWNAIPMEKTNHLNEEINSR
ncbi:hypothetical protein P167DRAFT_574367 [Morchella conica CCBAS932]|uniref:Tc1-like transposase DDE domain-containing protein n=1 Tax=Morchella conica CCBAS932 TaxID=1392247 RepID=A0A3N4KS45_9PEZI|nr:hypothetical protein P167DRAFT_574367 [Morchella conica CCBAS932]